ncbi:uncharacterized protein LOC106175924 [Lingula anatina]|uniref:Uncharacterized protein LOC106175924 n=1 Tax=Lingula anatina TaxID=7574 RepID=A0A1S3JTA1_LINAN|nr:uncharacterized protein LOC106175924 [Lingula anatina]|eukprot:XP_013413548.1 uncharacterized protein LOC106175924 [Lingula anatina]
MSFSTTYNKALKWDIKYTHFGSPVIMQWRNSGDYPNFDMLRIDKENKLLRRNILLASREIYSPKAMPPAPAFRIVSREDADAITQRLQRRGSYRDSSRSRSSTASSVNSDYSQNQREKLYGYKQLTPEQHGELMKRLSGKTHATSLRETQTSVYKHPHLMRSTPILGRRAMKQRVEVSA